jgi:hypothetical protein
LGLAPSRDVAAGRHGCPSRPRERARFGRRAVARRPYLAFVARDDVAGGSALWARSLQSNALERLAGTEDAAKPFWSPDSRRIGFFANGKLMTVDVTGRALTAVADVDVVVAGGTWGPDDTILFALWPSGLYAVPASGDGRVETVVKLDREARDIAFAWPQFLPDGRRFLYQIVSLDAARTGAYVATSTRAVSTAGGDRRRRSPLLGTSVRREQ